MREQIIDLLHRHYYPTMHESVADCTLIECADQVLLLISEEIEKVGNPYSFLPTAHSVQMANGFDTCRQRILALLKGDK